MKLRNKLILSCAALAAVATTAVSTTYAWYTSNVDVSASGITAKSASAADSTLLISKTGAQRSWGASVNLGMSVTETGSLVPVEYDAGSYYAWDIQHDTHATSAIDTTLSGGIYNDKILSFMLYFKSGTTDSLAVGWDGITITNTTLASLPSKTVLTNTGLVGISDPSYTCDIMRALRISTNAGASTEVASGFADQNATPTRVTYQLETNYHVADTDSLDDATSFNAHLYYDAVKGTSIATATKGAAGSSETAAQLAGVTAGKFATKINLGSTGAGAQAQAATPAADNLLAVRFDVYLDGWDTACFDACQGQTFTIALSFSVIA